MNEKRILKIDEIIDVIDKDIEIVSDRDELSLFSRDIMLTNLTKIRNKLIEVTK